MARLEMNHTSTRGNGLLACLSAFTLWTSVVLDAQSAELRNAEVTATAKGYRLRTAVTVAASASDVRDALAKFERLPALNPNIESVERLPSSSGGETRLLLKTKTCVLFFCQRYRWIQRVRTEANGDIVATVEPVNGDFRRGAFHYRFHPVGDNCLLVTEADLELKDGLPGGWLRQGLMEHVLGQEAVSLSSRLERLIGARSDTKSRTPA